MLICTSLLREPLVTGSLPAARQKCCKAGLMSVPDDSGTGGGLWHVEAVLQARVGQWRLCSHSTVGRLVRVGW